MQKLIHFLLAIMLMTGCARLREEPNPWNTTPVPVVFSLITPGSPVKVMLSASYSDRVKDPTTYPKAKVFITNGIDEVELTRTDSTFADSKGLMQIENGVTYTIRVESGDGIKPLVASTTVPVEAAQFILYSFNVTDTTNQSQYAAYFKCEWKIPSANKLTDAYTLITSWGWDLDAVKKSDNMFTVNNSQLRYPAREDNLTISLFTSDVWLGRLLLNKRYQNQTISQGMDITNVLMNEFSGVLPDFSNVENGAGIVGSYVRHTRDLEGNIVP